MKTTTSNVVRALGLRCIHAMAMFLAMAPLSLAHARQAIPFDYDNDGSVDTIELLHSVRGLVRIRSGATNLLIRVIAGAQPGGEGFATFALPVPDLSGDGQPDLLVGAPLAMPGGKLFAYARNSAPAPLWIAAGPPGGTLGYDAVSIVDQDRDGVSDILSSYMGPTDRAALISGRSGRVLLILDGTTEALAAHVAGGGLLYAPTDLDGSGSVDQEDLVQFFDLYSQGDSRADVNGDGQVGGEDVAVMLDDMLRGVTTVRAYAAAATGGGQGNWGNGAGQGSSPLLMPSCTPPDKIPPSNCDFAITNCPTNGLLVGSCYVFQAPPLSVANCANAAYECWYVQLVPTDPGSDAGAQIIRVSEDKSWAEVCFPGPGRARVCVKRTCLDPSNPQQACISWSCCEFYVYDCPDTAISVVLAPNGEPVCDGIGGTAANPKVVATGTTGWVGWLRPSPMLPLSAVWREGIVVEGRPAGGVFEAVYIDADNNRYSVLTGTEGLPIERFWEGPKPADEAGASRMWLMFLTSSSITGQAKFEFTYTLGICMPKRVVYTFTVGQDSDGDQIPDRLELGTSSLCPTLCTSGLTNDWDTDGDGVEDHVELILGTDPCGLGTLVMETDVDRDHIPDAAEAAFYHTSPFMFDTDMDGAQDDTEISLGLSPLLRVSNAEGLPMDGQADVYRARDLDSDGLADLWELQEGLVTAIPWSPEGAGLMRGPRDYPPHPNSDDEDHDGIQDGLEVRLGLDPLAADQNPTALDHLTDQDGDGLSDDLETRLGTNPLNPDSDGDGVPDGVEVRLGHNPLDRYSDHSHFDGDLDTDHDGLSDAEEARRCLDPRNPDTDGDGTLDGQDTSPSIPGPPPGQVECTSPDAVPVSFIVALDSVGNVVGHDGMITIVNTTTHTETTWSIGDNSPSEKYLVGTGAGYTTDVWYEYRVSIRCAPDGHPSLSAGLENVAISGDGCYNVAIEWRTTGSGTTTGRDVPLRNCASCQTCCRPGELRVYSGQFRFTKTPAYPRLVTVVIDDRNEHGIDPATGSFGEPEEHSDRGAGKLILVDSSDGDLDQVPAFADFNWSPPNDLLGPNDDPGWEPILLGGRPEPFAPMVINVNYPTPLCSSEHTETITLSYSASNPSSLLEGGGPPQGANPFDWYAQRARSLPGLRLWRKDAIHNHEMVQRDPRNVLQTGQVGNIPILEGDFVAPGTYPLQWFDPGRTGRIVLYIEAITPSASRCGQDIVVAVNFGANNPYPPHANSPCTAPSHPCGTSDSARVVGVGLDVFDMRRLPVVPSKAGDYYSDLKITQPATLPSNGTVRGAVADGASVCVVRVQPDVLSAGLTIAIGASDGRPLDPAPKWGSHEPGLGGFRVTGSTWGQATPTLGDIPTLPVGENPVTSGWKWSLPMSGPTMYYVPPETYQSWSLEGDGQPGTNVTYIDHADQIRNIPEDPFVNWRVDSDPLDLLPRTEWAPITFRLSLGSQCVGYSSFILRRPPLVLVHGITGHGDTPNHSEAYFAPGAYDELTAVPVPTRMYKVDYEATNERGFDVNFPFVAFTIQKAIDDYRYADDSGTGHVPQRAFRGARFAATRADVVAHSMGGNLARFYISGVSGVMPRGTGVLYGDMSFARVDQDPALRTTSLSSSPGRWPYLRAANGFAGDVHRLITIGTPYKGAHLAMISSKLFSEGSNAIYAPEVVVAACAKSIRNVWDRLDAGEIDPELAHKYVRQMRFLQIRFEGRIGAIGAQSGEKIADGEYDLRPNSEADQLMEGLLNPLPDQGNPNSIWAISSFPVGMKSVAWIPIAGLENRLEEFRQRLIARPPRLDPLSVFGIPVNVPEDEGGIVMLAGFPGAYEPIVQGTGILRDRYANFDSKAGLLRGDGTVPLESALNWDPDRTAVGRPLQFHIAQMHCHTFSLSGTTDSGDGQWHDDGLFLWEPETYSVSLRGVLSQLLEAGRRARYNSDTSLPGRPSTERLGR